MIKALVLAVLAFVVVLCIGMWFEWRSASREVNANAGDFLAAWATDDYPAAYDILSEETRKELPFDRFATNLSSQAMLIDGYQGQHRIGFNFEIAFPGPDTFEYGADVVFDSGPRGQFAALFVKEDGAWRIREWSFVRNVVPAR